MSLASFNQAVIEKFKAFVGVVESDIGIMAHALYANVSYDVKKAGAVAMEVAKEDFENLWTTAKAEIAQSGQNLLTTLQTKGFEAAKAEATALLANINWAAVGASLEGVGVSTLSSFASALLPMLVSGLLAAL